MRKSEFIEKLRGALSGLPVSEIEDRIIFYSEMIDDRMEEGLSEEDAVAAVGSVDEVAAGILREIPLARLVREVAKLNRRLGGWEIVLLVLSFPIWFSLLVAAAAVAFSLYTVIWSVSISLWAADFALFVGGGIGGIVMGIIYFVTGNVAGGFSLLGFSFVSLGLSIFFFYLARLTTKGTVFLTREIISCVKKSFLKKGA